MSDVATAYFRLLELDRQLEIARASTETYQRTLDVFTQRYQGGDGHEALAIARRGVVRAEPCDDWASSSLQS